MRVAAVQYKAVKGDKAGSLERLVSLATVAAQQAELVVLPEMAATGYLFDGPEAIAAVAEPAEGETFAVLAAVARAHGAWIVGGFPERAADAFFNSAHVIDAAGALRFVYRKTLLYEADTPWARPGDSGYASFDTEAGRFTVGICMDLNDDDFVAWCGASGARAVALPTNWIDEGQRVWGYWAWRLREVDAALVAANTYGVEGDVRFSGESAVLDGRVLMAHAPKEGDAVIAAALD